MRHLRDSPAYCRRVEGPERSTSRIRRESHPSESGHGGNLPLEKSMGAGSTIFLGAPPGGHRKHGHSSDLRIRPAHGGHCEF